jgi:hypothetical protein
LLESPVFPHAVITGSEWSPDWRDQAPVVPLYLGFGDTEATLNPSPPTGWNPHTGLVESDPEIYGYGGDILLQVYGIGDELRAGSTIAWPTSGQLGPNSEVPLLDLVEEAGVDVGLQLWSEPSPAMVFVPPPSYSEQSTMIPAVGV